MNSILWLPETRKPSKQPSRQLSDIHIHLYLMYKLLLYVVLKCSVSGFRNRRELPFTFSLVHFRQRERRCPKFHGPFLCLLYNVLTSVYSVRTRLIN